MTCGMYRQNLLCGGARAGVRTLDQQQIYSKENDFFIKQRIFWSNILFSALTVLPLPTCLCDENHFCQEAAARSVVINSQC